MKKILPVGMLATLAMLVLSAAAVAQEDLEGPVAPIDSGPLGEIVMLPDGSSRNIVSSSEATFTFHANTGSSEGPVEEAVTFECKLDEGPYAPCTSPHSYDDLPEGQHLFYVRAIDALGNVGDPAGWNWFIDLPDPPPIPTTEQECKKGGYKEFGFKNQRQCIKAVNQAS